MSATRRTVAIIDDDEDLRFIIRRALEAGDGFEVVAEAGTGEEALAIVGAHHPHVLLLDLGLSDVEEQELIPALLVAAPRTMVAVLTARAAEDREELARSAGAFTYYEKPMLGHGLVDYLRGDCALFERAIGGEDVVAPSAITRRQTAL